MQETKDELLSNCQGNYNNMELDPGSSACIRLGFTKRDIDDILKALIYVSYVKSERSAHSLLLCQQGRLRA